MDEDQIGFWTQPCAMENPFTELESCYHTMIPIVLKHANNLAKMDEDQPKRFSGLGWTRVP